MPVVPTPSEPGWYPDSRHAHLLRHWSGSAWSMQTKPNDAYVAPPAPASDATTPGSVSGASPIVDGKWVLRTRPERAVTPIPSALPASPAVPASPPAGPTTETPSAAEPARTLSFERVRPRATTGANDGAPAADAPAVHPPAASASGASAPSGSADDEYAQYWAQTSMFGPQLSSKSARIIRDASAPGELPWLVLANGAASAILVAFDDRALIIRLAKLTSFKPAGKPVTLAYADIASVGIAAGAPAGDLQIVTHAGVTHTIALTPAEHVASSVQLDRLRSYLASDG